jgi:hypothetical protein
MAGTLTIGGLAAGLASGYKAIGPITMTGTAVVGQVTDASLSSGDNAFTVPSNAYAVAIFLGANAVSATVKASTNLNSGDGGIELAPTTGAVFAVLPLPVGTTTLTLNSNATVANIELSFI